MSTLSRRKQLKAFTTDPHDWTQFGYDGRVKVVGSDRTYKNSIADEHAGAFGRFSQHDDHLFVYTDASQRHNRQYTCGAFVAYHFGDEVTTGERSYQADAKIHLVERDILAFAIHRILKFIRRNRPEVHHLHVFSDHAQSVTAVFEAETEVLNSRKTKHRTVDFWEIVEPWLEESSRNTIEIAWVPSRSEINGNDRADELAGNAVERAFRNDQEDKSLEDMLRRMRFR